MPAIFRRQIPGWFPRLKRQTKPRVQKKPHKRIWKKILLMLQTRLSPQVVMVLLKVRMVLPTILAWKTQTADPSIPYVWNILIPFIKQDGILIKTIHISPIWYRQKTEAVPLKADRHHRILLLQHWNCSQVIPKILPSTTEQPLHLPHRTSPLFWNPLK